MFRTFAGAVGALVLVAPLAAQEQADPIVRLMVFGEATYETTERDVPDGFSLGQLVAHLNVALDPRLSVFAEGTLTPAATSFNPSIERVIVRYDVNDLLKLSVGRYHTPISYWNTAFHHGSWLQPSIARPAPVAFSTPLIPIHFLGLLAEGAVPAGPVTVLYDAGVGNGRQAVISKPGDAGDDNQSRAVLGGLRVRSLRLHGVEVGAHAYSDRVPSPSGDVDERILSAHFVLEWPLQVISEFMRIHDDPRTGASGAFDTDAWYVHVGYRLPPSMKSLAPYVRWERIEPAAGDPLFGGVAVDYEAWIAGLRWDFSRFAALTGEFRDEDLPVDDGQSLLLNVAFVIPNLIGDR